MTMTRHLKSAGFVRILLLWLVVLAFRVMTTMGICTYYGDEHGFFEPSIKHPRVIVTGGAGFIGSTLVKRLRQTHGPGQVKVFDNLWRGKLENLAYSPGNYSIDLQTDFCNIDLRNETAALQAVRGAKTVFHLADVVAGVPFLMQYQEAVFGDNTLMLTQILRACRKNNIRQFIYAGSTCSSMLQLQTRDWITGLSENVTSRAESETAYGWSKLIGEYHAQLAQLDGVFDVGLLRFHNVFGPHSDWSTNFGQAVPILIRKAIQFPKETYNLVGAGSQYRDLLFVEDVVDALVLVQEKGLNKGVIQIGTEEATTVRQLALTIREMVQRKMNKTIVSHHLTLPAIHEHNYEGDRAWKLLQWTANHTLTRGISITVDWMLHAMNKTVSAPSLHSDRVLAILIGNPRGGPLAWKSLNTHVLTPLKADLMLYFGKSDARSENNVSFPYWADLHDMAKYIFFEREHNDWGVVLDQASLGHDARPTDWLDLCKFAPQWLGAVGRGCNHKAGAAIQLAFRYLVQQKLVSTGLINQYDHFIYTRSDFLYACDYPPMSAFDSSSLWIPWGEDYDGLNDRHMITTRKGILLALNLTRSIMSEPARWAAIFDQSGIARHAWNPERINMLYCNFTRGIRVRRFLHPAFIVKTAADVARWTQGDGRLLPPPLSTTLSVKYHTELRVSQQCPLWMANLETLIRTSPKKWFVYAR